MTNGFRPLDETDRQIVVTLQADGRISTTALAQACGTTVATASRRLNQLFEQRNIRVAVVPNEGARGPVDHFQVRLRCKAGCLASLVDKLAVRRDVRFLAVTTGAYDLMIEQVVEKAAHGYSQAVFDLLDYPEIASSQVDLIVREFKVSHDWSQQILGVTAPPERGEIAHVCDPAHMDAVDHQIVDCLRKDGRRAFTEIGALLDINESTVRRRFERLHQEGCVQMVTMIPALALGMEHETLLHIEVAPGRIEAVARELTRHRAARYVGVNIGECSLLCEVIAESTSALYQFIVGEIGQMAGVNGWRAHTELLSVKRGYVETPWWREQLRRLGTTAHALINGSDD